MVARDGVVGVSIPGGAVSSGMRICAFDAGI
jgi:hypothetical protein